MRSIASRLFVGTVIACSAGLALAGCAGNPEADYLQALKEKAPELYAAHTNRTLIANGYEACNTLDNGTSLTEALDKLANEVATHGDMSEESADWILITGAATAHLCTQYKGEFRDWLSSQPGG